MATLLRSRADEQGHHHADDERLSAFLAELGDLSRRHGFGLTDGAAVYMMEQEDYARSYIVNDQSELSFA